jgi:microcystin-dependent protein
MTLVDNFFPFDTGSGTNATPARWRLMARTWATSGVLPRYMNQMAPTIAGSVVTIDTGAAWIDGFYGENAALKSVSIAGNGMVVVRADPNNRQILIVFMAGQNTPTQSLTDIYEVPLCRINAGVLTDIRQFTSFGGVPAGVMWEFGGVTAPAGWLLCDGASYLRTDYAALFAAIGTAYNPSADGTHFNVPDTRGCVLIGAGGGPGLTTRSVGQRGGEENHTLSSAENGWHNHAGATGTESAWHIHGGIVSPSSGNNGPYGLAGGSTLGNTGVNIAQRAAFLGDFQTGNQNALHTHGIPVEGGNAHNNMPPFVVASRIIKT